MKQYYSHNGRNWQVERINALSLGYSSILFNIDTQEKPAVQSARADNCS